MAWGPHLDTPEREREHRGTVGDPCGPTTLAEGPGTTPGDSTPHTPVCARVAEPLEGLADVCTAFQRRAVTVL